MEDVAETSKSPDVLVVTPETSQEEILNFLMGGPVPEGAHVEDWETWTNQGRVEDCDCQLIQCVCSEARQHGKLCMHRIALTCAVPVACEHGFDVCPECDPCSCNGAEGT